MGVGRWADRFGSSSLTSAGVPLSAFLSDSPYGIYVADRTGLVWGNRTLCALFGRPLDALLGMAWAEFVHPDDRAQLDGERGHALETGRLFDSLRYRIVRRDGSVRWLLVRPLAMLDPDRGIDGGYIASADDITEVEEARVAHARAAERWVAILENLPVPVFESQAPGGGLFFNRAFRELFAVEVGDLSDSWLERVHPDDVERVSASVRAFRDTGLPFEPFPWRVIGQDGATRHVRVAIVKWDGAGRYIGAITDVTSEVRQASEETDAAAVRADAERFDALRSLAGGVAHQLNNALTVIVGYVGMLRDASSFEPDAAERLASIESAARQMGSLADQMAAFTGAKVRLPERLDVAETIRGAIRIVQPTCPTARFVLDPGAGRLHVTADARQLRQTWIELLRNATESAAGRSVTVGIAVRRADAGDPGREGDVHVAITDDGNGIDPSVLRHVLEPMFSTRAFGRGLGLAVVHGVVAAHRGSLVIDSTPGARTTVHVTLPTA